MSDPTRPPEGGTDPVTGEVTPPVPPVGAPREPVLTVGSIVAFVAAVLAVIVAFGPDLTVDQTKAVLGLALVVAPVVVAVVARAKAWSPQTAGATVRAEVAKALKARAAGPPPGDWPNR